MKKQTRYILALSVLLAALAITGCSGSQPGPRELLDKYFTSAEKQDYATTYSCYYKEYRDKVPENEFISRRKEASVVQAYQILSLETDKTQGKAMVKITFAPSATLKRPQPVTVQVEEDLIKEADGWKIKVW